MLPLPSKCPFCGGEIVVTRLHCQDCDSTFESRFVGGAFSQLTKEQLAFIELFVRCEGKISRMEAELGLSYPTIRNRLHEVIRALGYEPGKDEAAPAIAPGLSEIERMRVLEQLEQGKISYQQAMHLLQEGE